MSVIDRLLTNYSRQVRLPWSANTSGKQRVWFAVYPPAEERRVRARLPQFEALTLEANHGWTTVDLTRLLQEWISGHEYRESIFKEPEYFSANSELEDLAVERVRQACSREDVDADSVVTITGLATLFDFMRVSSLIERVEDSVRGRLLVFFPGEYAGNVYRFMDARDGFNYMAVPITTTESFINP
ncbi:MAG: BREX protein BrxB domain-containing protein [Pseudomonadota bacterium]